MRIAMIDPSLFTIPYDRVLIDNLIEAGHSVKLYGRRVGADDNDVTGIDLDADFYRFASGGIVTRLPRPLRLGIKGIDHLVSMLRLRSKLRATRPDLIHFQWLPLPIVDRYMLAGLRRIAPLVLTVHDTNPFNGDPSVPLQVRGFLHCLQDFDHLIVHTKQGRDRILNLGLPPSQVSVLPFGLMEALPPAIDTGPTEGIVTFLLFGKLKPYKGIDVLLEAFGQLPEQQRRQARIRVVGKAYMPLEPLQMIAREHDIADSFVLEPRFVADNEVNRLFSSDVVAVFPYREIEASAVLPFALANGRPVIASAIGEFAERIENGVQGLLVPPGDATSLSAAMSRMITDRAFAAACAAQARALAETSPDWQMIAGKTIDIYNLALSRAAARMTGASS